MRERLFVMLVVGLLTCGNAGAEEECYVTPKAFVTQESRTAYNTCKILNLLEDIARKMPEPKPDETKSLTKHTYPEG